MLGPDGAHLFFRGKLAARGGRLGFGHGLTLVRREGNGRSLIGAGKLHDRARDVVLLARRQSASGRDGLFEQLGHGLSIPQAPVAVPTQPTPPPASAAWALSLPNSQPPASSV